MQKSHHDAETISLHGAQMCVGLGEKGKLCDDQCGNLYASFSLPVRTFVKSS